MIFIQFCLGQSIGHGAKERTIKMHGKKKIVCATTAGKLTLNFTVNQIAPYKHTSHFSFLCLELTFKNVIKRWNKQ